mgnify:CR=1 FL=1
MNIKIKYFDGARKLEVISKGNWIDVYANADMIIKEGERAMIPLGFAMQLPEGFEAHLAPRSSTFKTWGIIQTNSVGVVDDTYIGDNDQWHMPVYCLQGKDNVDGQLGTIIRKGDKVALSGFGAFSVAERASRTGVNPSTKEIMTIEAKNVVKFKAGAELSDKVNL